MQSGLIETNDDINNKKKTYLLYQKAKFNCVPFFKSHYQHKDTTQNIMLEKDMQTE